jgi:hypothetical protein
MFSRVMDALDAVSVGNADAVNRISQILSRREGQTIIQILTINRQLIASDGPITIQLEDEDFLFLKGRIEQTDWSGLAARAALKLVEKLEAAEQEDKKS